MGALVRYLINARERNYRSLKPGHKAWLNTLARAQWDNN